MYAHWVWMRMNQSELIGYGLPRAAWWGEGGTVRPLAGRFFGLGVLYLSFPRPCFLRLTSRSLFPYYYRGVVRVERLKNL